MKYVMLVAMLVCAAMAGARENPHSGSRRFGSMVIQPGDSTARLVKAAGEPIKRVPVRNDYGKVIAEDFYYEDGRATVVVHTNPESGEVNWIEER